MVLFDLKNKLIIKLIYVQSKKEDLISNKEHLRQMKSYFIELLIIEFKLNKRDKIFNETLTKVCTEHYYLWKKSNINKHIYFSSFSNKFQCVK